jgi:hypothetical protein
MVDSTLIHEVMSEMVKALDMPELRKYCVP